MAGVFVFKHMRN